MGRGYSVYCVLFGVVDVVQFTASLPVYLNKGTITANANLLSINYVYLLIQTASSGPARRRPSGDDRPAKYWPGGQEPSQMNQSYATSLHFQRHQRSKWHKFISEIRKQEWRKRHFEQFMDEQIRQNEVTKNAKQ